MRDALDFLVAVHALDLRAAPAPPDLQAWCDVVLSTSPAQTGAVRAVSTRAAERLTGFPTVFGHGDFFGGNLLVEDGRLTGVLDWERAGPGHLALVDLLQLEICAELRAARPFFGDAIVDAALPTARSGGDELVRAYCNRLGIEVGAETLVALLAACWLSWVAFEAGRLADRAADREWVHRNVDQVAAALADATSSGA